MCDRLCPLLFSGWVSQCCVGAVDEKVLDDGGSESVKSPRVKSKNLVCVLFVGMYDVTQS